MALDTKALEQIEQLAQIVKNYRLESLKVGNIEIKKTIHDPIFSPSVKTPKKTKELTPEEQLDADLFDDLPSADTIASWGLQGA